MRRLAASITALAHAAALEHAAWIADPCAMPVAVSGLSGPVTVIPSTLAQVTTLLQPKGPPDGATILVPYSTLRMHHVTNAPT